MARDSGNRIARKTRRQSKMFDSRVSKRGLKDLDTRDAAKVTGGRKAGIIPCV